MKMLIILFGLIILIVSANSSKIKTIDNKTRNFINIPDNAIPFNYKKYVIINGTIDSLNGEFIIDTGGDKLLIDSFFYYSNNSKQHNYSSSTISGIGSSKPKIPVIIDSINFSIRDLKYITSYTPIINMKSIGGDLIDGALGIDFLKSQKILEINYAKEYACFYKSIDSVDISMYKAIPMKVIGHYYCVELDIKINDSLKIKGNFFIDTGMPVSIISSLIANKSKLENKLKHKVHYYTAYGGIGGGSLGCSFIADSLSISNFSLKNVVMNFSKDKFGVLASNKFMGIIGNNILEHFDVIFDFVNNNLYLKQNENFNDPFTIDKLGFLYVDRTKTMGGWIITGFYENSAAERIGLKVNDKIIAVDDIPVEKISYKDQLKYNNQVDNVKLTIKNNNGIKMIELKLETLL